MTESDKILFEERFKTSLWPTYFILEHPDFFALGRAITAFKSNGTNELQINLEFFLNMALLVREAPDFEGILAQAYINIPEVFRKPLHESNCIDPKINIDLYNDNYNNVYLNEFQVYGEYIQPFVNSIENIFINKYRIKKSKDFFEKIVLWVPDFVILFLKFMIIFEFIPAYCYNIYQILNQENIEESSAIDCVHGSFLSTELQGRYIDGEINYENYTDFAKFIDDTLMKIFRQNADSELGSHLTYLLTLELGCIRSDYSQSGMQLIAHVLNDKKLQEFTGITRKADSIQETGYMAVLQDLQKNYVENPVYNKYLTEFLNYFSHKPQWKTFLFDEIISKATVKDITMILPYHGTLRGFSTRFKDRLFKVMTVNLIEIPRHLRGVNENSKEYKENAEYVKAFYQTFHNLSSHITKYVHKKLIDDQEALTTFTKITDLVARSVCEKPNENNFNNKINDQYASVILNFFHLTGSLRTTKKYNITIKTTVKKKVHRTIMSYFGNKLVSKDLMRTLPANLAHMIDSCLLFYLRTIIMSFCNHELRIYAIHDAFIIKHLIQPTAFDAEDYHKLRENSNDYTIYGNADCLKDLLRVVTYLTYKHNILRTLVKDNCSTEVYNNFLKQNISTSVGHIRTRRFELLYKSDLFFYLFSNRIHWYYTKKVIINDETVSKVSEIPNLKFFYESLKYADSKDVTRLVRFLRPLITNKDLKKFKHILGEDLSNLRNIFNIDYIIHDEDLQKLREKIISLLLLHYLKRISESFDENFTSAGSLRPYDGLIVELHKIFTGHDFVKF